MYIWSVLKSYHGRMLLEPTFCNNCYKDFFYFFSIFRGKFELLYDHILVFYSAHNSVPLKDVNVCIAIMFHESTNYH